MGFDYFPRLALLKVKFGQRGGLGHNYELVVCEKEAGCPVLTATRLRTHGDDWIRRLNHRAAVAEACSCWWWLRDGQNVVDRRYTL